MKNTTIEIHGVQAFSKENKPNIILEFPGYSDELVTEISFAIDLLEPLYMKYSRFSIEREYPNMLFLSVPIASLPTSFVLDNFPKAEKFKFIKKNRNRERIVCEVSNFWSEKNRTMFLDCYPEYLLPKP